MNGVLFYEFGILKEAARVNSTSKSAAPFPQCSSTASPLSRPPCPVASDTIYSFESISTAARNLPKLPTTASPVSASIVAFPGVEIGHLAKRGPFNGRQTTDAVRNAQRLDFNEKRLLAMHYMLKMLERRLSGA